MKASLFVAGVVAMVTSAAALCDFGELPFQLGDVVEPAFQCQTASGYSFVQPSTLPTASQLTAICAKCGAFLSAVTKAKDSLPTCALAMDNGSTVTVDKLFVGVAAQCAGGAAADGSSGASADGSDAGTPAAGVVIIPTTPPSEDPTPTTATPAPKKSKEKTTEAPSSDDASDGSEEEDEDSDTTSLDGSTEEELVPTRSAAPEATTKAPRPAATKIATSSATTGASRMAVAAAVTCSAVVWALA